MTPSSVDLPAATEGAAPGAAPYAESADGAPQTAPNQFALLRQRRFAPFFCTQFLTAANDNVFKYAFTLLVTFRAGTYSTLDPALAVNLIAGVFIAPYLLFSAISGQLADKFDRTLIMRGVKGLEVGIMLLGAWGFVAHSFPVLLGCTFLMGLHSTLFGPAKYAYLPQHLAPEEMVGGNGMVEMGTFVAILLGTMVAGALIGSGPDGDRLAAAWTVGLAVLGVVASALMPRSRAADPRLAIDWNPFTTTWRNVQEARGDRAVFLSLLGISWLWFYGAIFMTQFPQFAHATLGAGPAVATVLLAVFTTGVAAGALMCETLSRRRVEIGLVPFGSIGMSVFAVDLYLAAQGLPLGEEQGVAAFLREPAHWRVIGDLFFASMFAGLYSVPLYALIQTRGDPAWRARVISANNILNALFLILAVGLAVLMLAVLDASIAELFLATGLLNAAVAVYIYGLVPEFLLRFLAWGLLHTMYRVRPVGVHHLPLRGAALIVSNHVSFVDALVLMGVSPRPIRFVMDHRIFRVPFLSWLFRHARAIPIAPAREDAAAMERAFEAIDAALRDGELVCIFPEGRLTDTGELVPFRPGVARILARRPVAVIPVALQGLWGSFFSRKGGRAMTRPLRRGILSRIGIHVDAPVPPELATPEFLQQRVAELRGAWR